MQTVRDVATLRTAIAGMRVKGGRVALIPTMGALHEGHLSLIAKARESASHVVASIFVNPRQFGANEDLSRYPRQEEADARLLRDSGCALLFAPNVKDVYPPGFATTVRVSGLDEVMEGASRPGHFDGVATVVTKLLALVGPDLALFGEKDWQQLAIIRRLTADLNLPVEIVGGPTIRDSDGLALSSRNAYLSPAQRQAASALPAALRDAARRIGSGESVEKVLADVETALQAAGFIVDYLMLCDEGSLRPLDQLAPGARLFVAARIGTTRLIDNMAVAV